MTEYAEDRRWADQHDIRDIVNSCAGRMVQWRIEAASEDDDRNHATDFYAVAEGIGRFACRLRRPTTEERDLTIRAARFRRDGTEFRDGIELAKIRRGEVKFMVYGWTSAAGQIAEWVVVNLAEMMHRGILSGRREIRNRPDRDGSYATFIAIPAHELIAAGPEVLIEAKLDQPTTVRKSGLLHGEDETHIVMAGIRLPRPTGFNCLEHPSYPTVWKDGKPWCRHGQHYPREATP